MKNLLCSLFIGLWILPQLGIGQIGIKLGSQPGTKQVSAILDLTGTTNQGLLIPRVNLTSTTSYAPLTGTAQAGMLVYNLATAGTFPNNVTPGFYYHDGTKWCRVEFADNATIDFNGGPVINNVLITPPATPADGDTYIVPAGATGAWLNQAPRIARFNQEAGVWQFTMPTSGERRLVTEGANAGNTYQFTSGSWVLVDTVPPYSPYWRLGGNYPSADNNIVGTLNTQPLRLFSNAREAMRINTNLNIGIGTTSAPMKVTVRGGGLLVGGAGSVNSQGTQILWNDQTQQGFLNYGFSNFVNHRGISGQGGFSFSMTENNTSFTQFMKMVGATGHVLIGGGPTDLPGDRLHILQGNARVENGRSFIVTSSGQLGTSLNVSNFVGLSSTNGITLETNGVERMRINAAGNLGIGTQAPTQALDLVGNLKFSGTLRPNDSPGAAGQILVSSGSSSPPTWVSPSAVGTINIYSNDGTLSGARTVTQGANALTFSGTGALNKISNSSSAPSIFTMGRTAGSAEFEIGVASAAGQGLAPSTVGDAWVKTNLSTGNLVLGTQSTTGVRIVTDNTERMVISATGNVGIGNSGPAQRLDVSGAIRSTTSGTGDVYNSQGSYFLWNSANQAGAPTMGMTGFINHRGTGPGGFIWSLTSGDGSVMNEVMRINPSGFLGLGVSAPSVRLHVDGSVRFSGTLRPDDSPGTAGQVLVSGGAAAAPTWVNQNTLAANNIYNTNGTLSGARTVTQGANALTFSGSAALNKFSGASGSPSVFTLGRTATEFEIGVASAAGQGLAPSTAGDAWVKTNLSTGNLLLGTETTTGVRIVTDNTERMTISSIGNVGIGNSGPSQRLDVGGAIRSTSFGTGDVYNSQGSYFLWNSANQAGASAQGMTGFINHRGTGPGGFIWSLTSGDGSVMNEVMRINSSGNLGLGTTTPAHRLSVDFGTTGSVNLGTPSGLPGAIFLSASNIRSDIRRNNDGLYILSGSSSSTPSGTQGIFVANGGNVGVGTESPTNRFHVQGTGRVNGNAFFRGDVILESSDGESGGILRAIGNSADPTQNVLQIFANRGGGRIDFYTNSTPETEKMRLTNAGFLGIGITNPTHILHINGQGRATNSAWATTSDMRLKENISNYSKGLAELMKIRTVEYNFKSEVAGLSTEEKAKRRVGILAQEIEKVLPNTVTKVKENGLEDQRVFNSDEVLFLLVNAVQELKNTVDAQAQVIENIKKEIQQLKSKP